jgi:hypothetical protein
MTTQTTTFRFPSYNFYSEDVLRRFKCRVADHLELYLHNCDFIEVTAWDTDQDSRLTVTIEHSCSVTRLGRVMEAVNGVIV